MLLKSFTSNLIFKYNSTFHLGSVNLLIMFVCVVTDALHYTVCEPFKPNDQAILTI